VKTLAEVVSGLLRARLMNNRAPISGFDRPFPRAIRRNCHSLRRKSVNHFCRYGAAGPLLTVACSSRPGPVFGECPPIPTRTPASSRRYGAPAPAIDPSAASRRSHLPVSGGPAASLPAPDGGRDDRSPRDRDVQRCPPSLSSARERASCHARHRCHLTSRLSRPHTQPSEGVTTGSDKSLLVPPGARGPPRSSCGPSSTFGPSPSPADNPVDRLGLLAHRPSLVLPSPFVSNCGGGPLHDGSAPISFRRAGVPHPWMGIVLAGRSGRPARLETARPEGRGLELKSWCRSPSDPPRCTP